MSLWLLLFLFKACLLASRAYLLVLCKIPMIQHWQKSFKNANYYIRANCASNELEPWLLVVNVGGLEIRVRFREIKDAFDDAND